ncbi:hypothetical protein Q8W71_24205 [Methylobacterium sp. NEAU 140]|uniref:hypothetical protein n=1 Tax=Methylobacterium sp. NEAU 140 TaxID=3064945 RepID=UPI0027327D15|nr:hypothetical protein [Methylobacterium sp. NEAU 140]MDP4025739.1 hypothetical protein [Methylobacterium sp. NEAU 140]
MRAQIWLALTLMICLIDGHAPRGRELRNPDAEGGWTRETVWVRRPSIRPLRVDDA